jgi:hypothetical protein
LSCTSGFKNELCVMVETTGHAVGNGYGFGACKLGLGTRPRKARKETRRGEWNMNRRHLPLKVNMAVCVCDWTLRRPSTQMRKGGAGSVVVERCLQVSKPDVRTQGR